MDRKVREQKMKQGLCGTSYRVRTFRWKETGHTGEEATVGESKKFTVDPLTPQTANRDHWLKMASRTLTQSVQNAQEVVPVKGMRRVTLNQRNHPSALRSSSRCMRYKRN